MAKVVRDGSEHRQIDALVFGQAIALARRSPEGPARVGGHKARVYRIVSNVLRRSGAKLGMAGREDHVRWRGAKVDAIRIGEKAYGRIHDSFSSGNCGRELPSHK